MTGRNLEDEKYKAWRNAVYKRDRYTCKKCGQRGGKLNAHHIRSWAKFPRLRYVVSNGKTLCESCHKKTRSYKKYLKWKKYYSKGR